MLRIRIVAIGTTLLSALTLLFVLMALSHPPVHRDPAPDPVTITQDVQVPDQSSTTHPTR